MFDALVRVSDTKWAAIGLTAIVITYISTSNYCGSTASSIMVYTAIIIRLV